MKKMFGLLFVIFLVNFSVAQTVEFQVDMGVQAQKGRFTVGDPVKIAGNFNEWNTEVDVLTDTDLDTIYTITKTFDVGDTLFFKFIKRAADWESISDREYIVSAGTNTFFAYFNDDDQYAVPDSIDVTFSCDLEFEIVSGRFNPTTDTLSVRGSFNEWSSNSLLSQSGTNPNVYEGTYRLFTFEGDQYNYKYAYFGPNGTTWENDPNKTYTITEDDMTFGSAFISRVFNDATLETVTNNPATIKFTVNMTGAISAVNNQPFTVVENVALCGANAPLRWPDGGWPDVDSVKTIKLFDDGTNGDLTAGDNIWSKDVVFPQYSPLRIQYKYGANYGLPSLNQGGNDNENGVGADHFIALVPSILSGTVENTFGTMGDHTLINVVTDVNDGLSGIVETYQLEQNYPNPFNPSTVIRFGIPESGFVTLKIYNALGQEITTLVNEFKNAGPYNVNFDASKLSSGVYFYTINANNFISTKKMLLMK